MVDDAGLRVADWWLRDHGDCCDCVVLARAFGAGPEAVDFHYCRFVLQKHWRLNCNHGCRVAGKPATPQWPRRGSGDAVQTILAVNAYGASR